MKKNAHGYVDFLAKTIFLRQFTFTLYFQVKELPTYKDVDFRNNMQKVYVSDEERQKIMDKLSRDIEVRQRR